MKKKVWLSALSMGVLFSGGGIGAGAQEASPSSPVEFVGVTPVSFKPGWGGGLAPFIRACQASFSGSHVCSSNEILQSGKFPDFPADLEYPHAWVTPSVVSVFPDPSDSRYFIVADASGLTLQTNHTYRGLSCDVWQRTSGWGLTVSKDGAFSFTGCDSSAPVACCVGKAAR